MPTNTLTNTTRKANTTKTHRKPAKKAAGSTNTAVKPKKSAQRKTTSTRTAPLSSRGKAAIGKPISAMRPASTTQAAANVPVSSVTQLFYDQFRVAFDFFDARIWNSALPEVLITLTRNRKVNGEFRPRNWVHAGTSFRFSEISLNAETLDRGEALVLGTLVHEMTRARRCHCIDKPALGSHDVTWADEMKRVGLHPSSTGKPGGRETGDNVTHSRVLGGNSTKLLESCWRWVSNCRLW